MELLVMFPGIPETNSGPRRGEQQYNDEDDGDGFATGDAR
jgi:hypothetical protein